MGTLNCGAFVIEGGRTLFDQMQGLIDEAIEGVEAAETGLQFHKGDGPLPEGVQEIGPAPIEYMQELLGESSDIEGHILPHILDPQQEMLARLKDCKEMVEAVWYAVLDAKEMAE